MPTLGRSMGRSKPDGRCKKHPKHHQSPGVCSVCLSEKLSQLSTATTSQSRSSSTKMGYASCSSSSLSSYYSSCSCSSCSSPMHHYRYTTEGKGSFRLFFLSGKNIMLTKSRSLAFVPRIRGNRGSDGNDKKKGGFWSKMLLRRPRNKRMEEGFVRCSSTMRERVITL